MSCATSSTRRTFTARISQAKPSACSRKRRPPNSANTAPAGWYWRRGINCRQTDFMDCPLCKNRDVKSYPNVERNYSTFECNNCGKFAMTGPALSAIGENGWKLAAYVLEKNRLETTPTFYSSQQTLTKPTLTGRSFQEDAPAGSVGVDTAIETFPKTVAERLDRVLLNLAAVTKHLGQQIKIGSEGVNPLLLAQNSGEVFFVIEQFAQEGYIKGKTTSLPTEISLTAKGLNRAADLQRGLFGPLNKQVFVAMS